MLIGLHGRKQAGKDTAYQRLAALFGDVFPVERVSFADKLYRSAAAALGVTPEVLEAWKLDPSFRLELIRREDTRAALGPDAGYLGRNRLASLSIREYLQRYGTEAHRDVFGVDFWVEQADLAHRGKLVAVTDVRFPNEAAAVRAKGGVVVRVVGPPEVENAGDEHVSERPLPGTQVDAVVYNTKRDDGFTELDTQLRWLVGSLTREEAGQLPGQTSVEEQLAEGRVT